MKKEFIVCLFLTMLGSLCFAQQDSTCIQKDSISSTVTMIDGTSDCFHLRFEYIHKDVIRHDTMFYYFVYKNYDDTIDSVVVDNYCIKNKYNDWVYITENGYMVSNRVRKYIISSKYIKSLNEWFPNEKICFIGRRLWFDKNWNLTGKEWMLNPYFFCYYKNYTSYYQKKSWHDLRIEKKYQKRYLTFPKTEIMDWK